MTLGCISVAIQCTIIKKVNTFSKGHVMTVFKIIIIRDTGKEAEPVISTHNLTTTKISL